MHIRRLSARAFFERNPFARVRPAFLGYCSASSAARSSSFSRSVELNLVIEDPDVCETLREFDSTEERNAYAKEALRIGVTALRRVNGDATVRSVRDSVDALLSDQEKSIVKQFSLDEKDSALSRFLRELRERHSAVNDDLKKDLRSVTNEFSLDVESSALSRLVRNMETAQNAMRTEFSLDHAGSSLSRLRRELEVTLKEQHRVNREFQIEMASAIRAMDARRAEEKMSTRHGLSYEMQMMDVVHRIAASRGDVAIKTGATTGAIRRCKVGDGVIELGPDSAAPGARIVLEAKQDKRYTLAAALEEMRTARQNREAQIGIFVWSKRTAPNTETCEMVARYGDDVVVIWDSENPASDLYLDVGISLARALCVRRAHHGGGDDDTKRAETDALISEIDRRMPELERETRHLGQVETWAETIRSNAEKILKRVEKTRKELACHIGKLHSAIDRAQ